MRFLTNPQKWSVAMDSLYSDHVHNLVVNNECTDTDEKGNLMPLGIPFGLAREKVIGYGRTDFSASFENDQIGVVSPDEKVLLYCYMILRRHFWSSYANLKLSKPTLTRAFNKRLPILVDIGCGPGTTGLAFAEVFAEREFTYLAVDAASPMRSMCRRLLKSAKDRGIVSENTVVKTISNWEKLPARFPACATVLFNFSFFFANKSLTRILISSLADRILDLGSGSPNTRFFVSYTNSTLPKLSNNYLRFLKKLGFKQSIQILRNDLQSRSVTFHPRRNAYNTNSEKFLRELFELSFK